MLDLERLDHGSLDQCDCVSLRHQDCVCHLHQMSPLVNLAWTFFLLKFYRILQSSQLLLRYEYTPSIWGL